MAAGLKRVFLSASIPRKDRDPRYDLTADVNAIGEAVRALALTVMPRMQLVFGGHPAISPFILTVARQMGTDEQVQIHQSRWFENQIPTDSLAFSHLRWTPAEDTRKESLQRMRMEMIGMAPFTAGFFIGGMDGVEDEYALFRQLWPDAPAYPIASTGAAALTLYQRDWLDHANVELRERLRKDLVYDVLFEDLLNGAGS